MVQNSINFYYEISAYEKKNAKPAKVISVRDIIFTVIMIYADLNRENIIFFRFADD